MYHISMCASEQSPVKSLKKIIPTENMKIVYTLLYQSIFKSKKEKQSIASPSINPQVQDVCDYEKNGVQVTLKTREGLCYSDSV